MGAQNRGFSKIRDMIDIESKRQNIQRSIDEHKTIEERRKYGQFATSFQLSREIVYQGLKFLESDDIYFLEPALGTGAFYSALLDETNSTTVVAAKGIEIDPMYAKASAKLWSNTGLQVLCGDFTREQPDQKYNLVLTNPPYVRHHYLSHEDKANLIKMVKNETGIELSGLSGLYCYYLLLAHKWLAPGAVSGWLLPSEFMDVNYGKAIKEYLLNDVHLLKIHRYDENSSQFNDALVSSCVVWFKNEVRKDDYTIDFTYGGSHESPKFQKIIKRSELSVERKWTRFPEKSVRNDEESNSTIGDFFTIKRGLATGDNTFFILTADKINELGLKKEFFKPILPSPRYLKTDYIEADEIGNPKIDKQYFLLDCMLTEAEIESQYPSLWNYLQSGIPDVSGKYLCKNRKQWYFQEQRKPTPFLCSYMGRGKKDAAPIRFIYNTSNAIVTNSYLMLYPKDNLLNAIHDNSNISVKVWEILKSISASDIEDEGRVYGGGLRKIEPKELGKVRCPEIKKLCTE